MQTIECRGRREDALARGEQRTRGAAGLCIDENAAAKGRLLSRKAEPLFIADWDRAVFIHYQVDPDALQAEVPFRLDRREDKAYVSLVAFTLRGLRPRFGGKPGEWLFKPIATHEFLNVRTYVRHEGEPGIYFISEWLSNSLSVRLGPGTFGLPYRYGRLEYRHHHETGKLGGCITDRKTNGRFAYEASVNPLRQFAICPRGSLDEFLVERYTAFTSHGGRRRFFRIWHEPWLQTPAAATVGNDVLLANTYPWFRTARLVGANYSPGAPGVWMGWPRRIGNDTWKRKARHAAFFDLP